MPESSPQTPLHQALRDLRGGIGIAFSGGVDSAYLLRTAQDAAAGPVVALLAVSDLLSQRELVWARRVADSLDAALVHVWWSPLSVPMIRTNSHDRCYHCKLAMYGVLWRHARRLGLAHLLDGTQADDLGQNRPGLRAVHELEVLTPLADCGLTKLEIRCRSAELGLPTWNRASQSCLATRVPEGTPLTLDALKKIEVAERAVLDLGFGPLRVRYAGETAVLQVSTTQRSACQDSRLWSKIVDSLLKLGFRNVILNDSPRHDAPTSECLCSQWQRNHDTSLTDRKATLVDRS